MKKLELFSLSGIKMRRSPETCNSSTYRHGVIRVNGREDNSNLIQSFVSQ